jgi:5-methylcytosine-specific restriction protein B
VRAEFAAVAREHVLVALERIRRDGVPPRRRATRYTLTHDDVRYPPKYVFALAVEAATGVPLAPRDHTGGQQTNAVLERLGFAITLSVRAP